MNAAAPSETIALAQEQSPAMSPTRRDREVLDSGEDVTGWTDRELTIRIINALGAIQELLGALLDPAVAERIRRRARASAAAGIARPRGRMHSLSEEQEDDITLVRELRLTARRWRRRTMAFAGAVLVIVVAAAICKLLHINPVGG